MYRRDLLTAEIQKLAEALARILGMKQQGKLKEAEDAIDALLENDFGILFTDLLACDEKDFAEFLSQKKFPAEKLDFFSQVLYLKFNSPMIDQENKSLAEKLQLIYQILERQHHVINMINIDRQKNIEKYLKNN